MALRDQITPHHVCSRVDWAFQAKSVEQHLSHRILCTWMPSSTALALQTVFSVQMEMLDLDELENIANILVHMFLTF